MSRKPKNKCITPYCKNDKIPGRKICHKCKSRRDKENNPFYYSFNALRNNAKRRGKEFTLTLEQFKQFCYQTGYHIHKGKTCRSYSIDRIKNDEGYTMGNIQILTLQDNGRKADKDECPF